MQDLQLLDVQKFRDDRGWFCEIHNAEKYRKLGIECDFVQDNQSFSRSAGTLRGLHLQMHPMSQAKLVSCSKGEIFDVAVDLRLGSATFGRWKGFNLSAANGKQLFVPEGFAHGFVTLTDDTEVFYKCSSLYDPKSERAVRWDDSDLNIVWPINSNPILSKKDAEAKSLKDLVRELKSL